MAEFAIVSDDDSTEAAFLEYKQVQIGLRLRVAGLHSACSQALAAYTDFEARVGDGGDLAGLSEYHTAKAAGLAGAEGMLRDKIGDLVALIAQMESASPGLFPGVVMQ
jgi:hypothetical protein